jgi:hypothetical protein
MTVMMTVIMKAKLMTVVKVMTVKVVVAVQGTVLMEVIVTVVIEMILTVLKKGVMVTVLITAVLLRAVYHNQVTRLLTVLTGCLPSPSFQVTPLVNSSPFLPEFRCLMGGQMSPVFGPPAALLDPELL